MPTALSTHTACFICREKGRKLRQIHEKDVKYAYENYKIIIKTHARYCDAHFDANGLIRKEEYAIIPTKDRLYPLETLKMFSILSSDNCSIFDQFKDIEYLEDDHCKRITGWSKLEFIRFSEFITSTNTSSIMIPNRCIKGIKYCSTF